MAVGLLVTLSPKQSLLCSTVIKLHKLQINRWCCCCASCKQLCFNKGKIISRIPCVFSLTCIQNKCTRYPHQDLYYTERWCSYHFCPQGLLESTQNESCSTCNETPWICFVYLYWADIKPSVSLCCWEHCLKHYSVYILCYCVRRWRQRSTTWRCFMGKEENTKKQNRCVKELWRSERRWDNTRVTTLKRI